MRKRTQSREYALQILYQHEMNPQTIEELMDSFWNVNPNATDEVRIFAYRLVSRTLTNLEAIDAAIAKAMDHWELTRVVILDKNIMRMAVCELLYFADVPPKVALNEAVNLAKKFSQEESGKFVNGVLDKISHSEPFNLKNFKGPVPELGTG
ncbi:MAG: transcription antitermination factor NusB [Candidatus Omnitrophica bacterium]|nr:transcription antitermination factor NusB [Candidatus Omnitrophota bacterium]